MTGTVEGRVDMHSSCCCSSDFTAAVVVVINTVAKSQTVPSSVGTK